MPAEGASLGESYSTYYTRVRVINNGGTTSGGSSVLRSLFPTPFYVDYDAVSSFQPPATPRVPHSIGLPPFLSTLYLPPPSCPTSPSFLRTLSDTTSPSSTLLSLLLRDAYTQSTRPTQSLPAGHRAGCCGPSCEIRTAARQHGSATDLWVFVMFTESPHLALVSFSSGDLSREALALRTLRSRRTLIPSFWSSEEAGVWRLEIAHRRLSLILLEST